MNLCSLAKSLLCITETPAPKFVVMAEDQAQIDNKVLLADDREKSANIKECVYLIRNIYIEMP